MPIGVFGDRMEAFFRKVEHEMSFITDGEFARTPRSLSSSRNSRSDDECAPQPQHLEQSVSACGLGMGIVAVDEHVEYC